MRRAQGALLSSSGAVSNGAHRAPLHAAAFELRGAMRELAWLRALALDRLCGRAVIRRLVWEYLRSTPRVYASIRGNAFALLTDWGRVVTWGAPARGDSSRVAAQLSGGVRAITAEGSAFKAEKTDGTIVAWETVACRPFEDDAVVGWRWRGGGVASRSGT